MGVVLMVGIFASPVTAGCATGDLNTNAPDLPLSGSGGAGGLPGPSGASILAGVSSGEGDTSVSGSSTSGYGSSSGVSASGSSSETMSTSGSSVLGSGTSGSGSILDSSSDGATTGSDQAAAEMDAAGADAGGARAGADATRAADADAAHTADADAAATDAHAETGSHDGPKCASNVLRPVAAVGSSTHNGNVAAFAIDAMFGTRWESDYSDPQWIYLDFGASAFIDRVGIAWENACGKDYELQVADTAAADASAWKTISQVTGNTKGTFGPPMEWATATEAVDYLGLAGVGRYLRVHGSARCTAYGYSIWEMRAFGDTNANCAR